MLEEWADRYYPGQTVEPRAMAEEMIALAHRIAAKDKKVETFAQRLERLAGGK